MTLEKITYDQLPFNNRQNPNKKFADQCVADFLKLDCDAVKISGWPIRRGTPTLRSTIEKSIKDKAATARVKAHADKEFVYLSRVR